MAKHHEACRTANRLLTRAGMQVENEVVGAPCGVMDQMAAAVGEADSLLCLTCQPAVLHPPVPIPAGIRFWALDSGMFECHAYRYSCTASVRLNGGQ